MAVYFDRMLDMWCAIYWRYKSKFRSRENNYKGTQRNFTNKETISKQALRKKRFHEDYYSDRHNGKKNWVITLIDSVDTLKELNSKKLYWMYRLKTCAPYGFNEAF